MSGADFNSQQYRHGVLIGNWNEDQFGLDILKSDSSLIPSATSATAAAAVATDGTVASSSPPSSSSSSSSSHFLTTSRLAFTRSGHSAIHSEVFHSKFRPRMAAAEGTDRALIFQHRGADPAEMRYITMYNASWGKQMPNTVFTVNAAQTLAQARDLLPSAAAAAAGADGVAALAAMYPLPHLFAAPRLHPSLPSSLRHRSYGTATADAHGAAATVMAVAPAAAEGERKWLRKGNMEKTFESSYRKLRLRKE